jgi:hypothetical protein
MRTRRWALFDAALMVDILNTLETADALDLTVETLIADGVKPYAWLFTDEDRAAARERLASQAEAISKRRAAEAEAVRRREEERRAQIRALHNEKRGSAAFRRSRRSRSGSSTSGRPGEVGSRGLPGSRQADAQATNMPIPPPMSASPESVTSAPGHPELGGFG